MCGLSGYFGSKSFNNKRINEILSTMSNRGPDAFGYKHFKIYGKNLYLFHSRLKIIDLHPINYHPVPPSKLSSENHKLFSNSIYLSNEKNKLPYLPFSSSFMVTARKMK